MILHHIHQTTADSLMMICRSDQQIMDISSHDTIVHRTYQPDKPVAIPCCIDSLKIPHCHHQFFWIMARRPLYRKEQRFQIFLPKLMYVFIYYFHIIITRNRFYTIYVTKITKMNIYLNTAAIVEQLKTSEYNIHSIKAK